jgi:hypothetical protein
MVKTSVLMFNLGTPPGLLSIPVTTLPQTNYQILVQKLAYCFILGRSWVQFYALLHTLLTGSFMVFFVP